MVFGFVAALACAGISFNGAAIHVVRHRDRAALSEFNPRVAPLGHDVRSCPAGDRRIVRLRFERKRVVVDGRVKIVRHRLANLVRCRRIHAHTTSTLQPVPPPRGNTGGTPSTTTTSTTSPGGGGAFDPVPTSQWAGYFEAPGTVTSVSATWVVPSLVCPESETTLSSTWIGVGGFAGGTLLQAGMYDNCLGGTAVQGAFAEEAPGSTVSFQLPISPGDTVSATVSSGPGGWQTTVADLTTDESATENWSGYAGGDSAGWMAEAYGAPGDVPMSNFGTEQLSAFSVNGGPASIPESDVYAMVNVLPTDPASGIYRLTYE
jgi:Peptidase A4 family